MATHDYVVAVYIEQADQLYDAHVTARDDDEAHRLAREQVEIRTTIVERDGVSQIDD